MANSLANWLRADDEFWRLVRKFNAYEEDAYAEMAEAVREVLDSGDMPTEENHQKIRAALATYDQKIAANPWGEAVEEAGSKLARVEPRE